LQPESIQAFVYDNDSGTTNGFYLHHCHISRAGRGVIYGERQLGAIVNDVRIYNNTWEGPGNLDVGGFHSDGLMIGNPYGDCPTGASVTNISFHDNFFYGDWGQQATAQYYSNGCTSNTLIYNNVFAFENVTGTHPFLSPAFVFLGYHDGGTIGIYNNIFSSDADPGYETGTNGAIMIGTPNGGSLTIMNNIFSGIGNDILYDDGFTSVLIDYNLHNTASGGRLVWQDTGSAWECHDLATCRAHGMETHAPAMSDPRFVAIPNGNTGSGNWHLQPGSPAINTGTSLASIFTTDLDGLARPQGSAWDIGTYEYASGAPSSPTLPSSPKNLRIR
jgi:hypothetical protein